MKTLHATCTICGKKKIFTGITVHEVCRAIDQSGWCDYPDDGKTKFICDNENCIDKRNKM